MMRLTYLDGLRFLVAAFLVAHHTFVDFEDIYPASSRIIRLFSNNANYGVVLFFVLSGYCLMLPLLRTGRMEAVQPLRFLRKRAVRLLLPYYAGLAFSLALSAAWIGDGRGHHWDMSLGSSGTDMQHALMLLQNYLPRPSPGNYSYWFIAVLWQMSMLFPFVALLWRKLSPIPALALAIGVSEWLQTMDAWPLAAGGHFNEFLVGMFAASVAYETRPSMRALRTFIPWRLLAVLLGGVAALQFWDTQGQWPAMASLHHAKYILLSLWIGSAFIVCANGGFGMMRSILGWQPLAVLGGWSYGIYLVHAPLVEIAHRSLLPRLDLSLHEAEWAVFLLLLPGIAVIAYPFHLLTERVPASLQRACKRMRVRSHQTGAVLLPA